MTTRVSADVWTRLTAQPPSGDRLTARRAFPDPPSRVLCAVDAGLLRHLLVQLASTDQPVSDSRSRGLTVETRSLHVEGHPDAIYLDVTCHDASGHDALDLIAGEIESGLSAAGESPEKVVGGVLAKWRRFWGQPLGNALSRDEQLGLFGELWFLLNWAAPKVGIREALHRWRGPSGSRHDFEWVGGAVEAKTTLSTTGLVHRINGLDQLAPPETGRLLLFSLKLREEAGAEHTLPHLVSEVRKLSEDDSSAQEALDSALASAGYSPAHADEYDALRLRVVEQGLYRVEGRFPRITRSDFGSGPPEGVSRVEYCINLEGYSDLRVAQQPDDLRGL
jgi:putative PD-(D/E)XK family protein DUF4420